MRLRVWALTILVMSIAGSARGSTAIGGFDIGFVDVRIGLRVTATTEQLRQAFGIDHSHGILVVEVDAGGAAEKAGLRAGDVLTTLAQQPVARGQDVLRVLEGRQPGDEVAAEYVRGRVAQTAMLRLDEESRPRVRIWEWWVPTVLDPGGRLARDLHRMRTGIDRHLRELVDELRQLEEQGRVDSGAVRAPACPSTDVAEAV
jgi:membrane-associated protease RseP (regulator of RpoE activity)